MVDPVAGDPTYHQIDYMEASGTRPESPVSIHGSRSPSVQPRMETDDDFLPSGKTPDAPGYTAECQEAVRTLVTLNLSSNMGLVEAHPMGSSFPAMSTPTGGNTPTRDEHQELVLPPSMDFSIAENVLSPVNQADRQLLEEMQDTHASSGVNLQH